MGMGHIVMEGLLRLIAEPLASSNDRWIGDLQVARTIAAE